LTEAFRFFEGRVVAGELSGYGVSSNTAIESPAANDATSLTRMLEAARAAGGDSHNFRILQIPLNLYEPGALLERNNGPDDGQTVLEAAAAAGIAVLANRPLNAFGAGALVRLADVEVEDVEIDWDEQLGKVADEEMTFRAEIAPQLQAAPDAMDPGEYFRMAERLKEARRVVTSLAHWSQLEAQINYTVSAVVVALNRQLEGEIAERWIGWRDAYLGDLEDLMREMRRQAAERSQEHNSEILAAIDPLLPERRRGESLSRKALWTVASTPGVTCVLNGMRSEAYVEDSLGVLHWPKLEDVQPLYRAAQTLILRR
jgi:aryl-alcohol dehydrogenase-like predicted oxidoreductase